MPISRFGLGILSVFMIGDRLRVITRNGFSVRNDYASRKVVVEARFGLAFVREGEGDRQGTKVSLRLIRREQGWYFLVRMADYLKRTIRRPPVPISMKLGGVDTRFLPEQFMELRIGAREKLEKKGVEVVEIDVGRWSERITGRIIVFLFREDQSDKLVLRREGYSKISDFEDHLVNFAGNRVTVSGISMKLPSIGRLFGRRQARLIGAVDVDLVGSSDVKYDVARQKLVGSGVGIARSELRKALVLGLRGENISSRIQDPPPFLHNWKVPFGERRKVRQIEDEKLLAAVKEALPDEPLPIGIHRRIAEGLGERPSVVYRAIYTLRQKRQRGLPFEPE